MTEHRLGFWAVATSIILASALLAADKPAKKPGWFDPKVKPASATTAATLDRWSTVVATVNNEEITREQLAEELIQTYGRKQLDLIINRKVIEQSCKQAKIDVNRAEIEQDLQDNLRRFNIKRNEFIERVLGSREMTYAQYVRDTVWPALALKKLVQGRVTVTDDDLRKSFEANYGPKVDVRMIVVLELRKCQELWEQVNGEKDPKKRLAIFEDLAKTHSIDQATRAFGGKTQPINKHTGYPEIENVAFALRPGDLSKIIQTPEGNVILLCVQQLPARTDVTLETTVNPQTKETIRDVLLRDLKEKKTRIEVANFFKDTRDKAVVKDFMSGDFDAQDLKAIQSKEPANPAEVVDPSAPKAN